MDVSLFALENEVSQAFESIPIIDLESVTAFSSEPSKLTEEKKRIAREISDACVNVGFFYIKNHGIPPQLVSKAFEAGKRFFDLPLEEKMKIDVHASSAFRGYNSLLSENVDPENRGDLHEGFNLGPDGGDATAAMVGQNLWPDPGVLPGFKEEVWEYYEALLILGRTLFTLFALALGLEETFFEDKIENSAAIMRLLHYPPQQGTIDDRIMGIGAHSDYECFTILRQDDVPALQVLNAKNKWIDAPPIKDTFVVNIGDQLARWTNDIFKSTTHRAINRSGIRRYSSPLFFGTDYNVLIKALPTCLSEDRPAKYEPVLAGEYVKAKLAASYANAPKKEG